MLPVIVGLNGEPPVRANGSGARRHVEREMVPRRQLPSAFVQRVRSRYVAIREELLQRPEAQSCIEPRMLGQRRKFARKGEQVGAMAIIEWLLTESIAGQEQSSAKPIINRESKH